LITGGNGGIGSETAKELVRRGATVYLACRNVKRGEEVQMEIEKTLRESHELV
jgi:NAD(P)-dependent dehydrogenase (short-subunit alcohol dehydrogenase family)